MEAKGEQPELTGLVWRQAQYPFRLRVNDVLRVDHRLGLVIRVSDCSAVVLVNRPARTFTTRFDKLVRLQPAAFTFRISPNSEVEIINRPTGQRTKRKPR